MVESTNDNSLQQMAEEIFSLTTMSWRERIASRSGREHELSEVQFLTLEAVLSAGEPRHVGDLHRSLGVVPAQMSRIIRALEKDFSKPLIQCKLNPGDKRKIDVYLTAAGKSAYGRFRTLRVEKTIHILRGLSAQDRLDFNRICRHIRDLYSHAESANKPPA